MKSSGVSAAVDADVSLLIRVFSVTLVVSVDVAFKMLNGYSFELIFNPFMLN